MTTNWTETAALEISKSKDYKEPLTRLEIQAIIEEHCPFEKDVVYEPVTETSRKLDRIISLLEPLDQMIRYLRGRV